MKPVFSDLPLEKILIFDPSANHRNCLREILGEVGYHCLTVTKLCQFNQEIKNNSLGAVLINIKLPELDGYKVCQFLKEDPKTQTIPVILISHSLAVFDREKAFTSGCADYLIAPFIKQEVISRVKSQIELKAFQHQGETSVIRVEKRIEQQLGQLNTEINQYRQIEKELRKSNQKYQAILATTLEGFWLVDSNNDGKILTVNDAYCRMTGYSKEELLNMSISDLEVIENPQEVQEHLAKIANQGSDRFETIHRCKDGRKIYLEISVTYIKELNIYFSFFRDISDRKQRELNLQASHNNLEVAVNQQQKALKTVNKTLQQNEARYRYLYHHTPVMLHSLDKTGTIINVSDYWLEKLGYQREEVINKPFSTFLTSKSRTYFEKMEFPQLLESKEVSEIPYQVLCRNGEIIEVLLSAVAETAENGEFLSSLSVMTDITQQHNMEIALRQSENRLQTIVNSTTDGLLIVDQEGMVRFTNPSAAKLLNKSQNKLINFHFGLPIVSGETAELDIIHDQNEIGVGEMSMVDVEWENEMVHVVSIRDITERKYTALALQEQQEFLKAIFEQAAVGLALIKAHGQLKQVNQRLCEITGYSEGELLEMNLWQLTYPEDHKREDRKFRELFGGKAQTFAHEKRIIQKNGSLRWVNMAVSLASDLIRSPYFIGVIEDIQTKKEFELNLNQSLIRERTTARIIERMRQSLDLGVILDSTTQDVRETLNCDRVAIYQFNRDWSGYFVAESIVKDGKPLSIIIFL